MEKLKRTQMKMDERRKSKIGGDVNFDIGDDDDDDYFYDDDDNDDDGSYDVADSGDFGGDDGGGDTA